jgi:hypothetical protein
MIRACAVALVLVFTLAAPASADELTTYVRKNFATMQWYVRHCRQLSRLEIAVRKLPDLDAFVCDPAAGKQPKQLTPAYVRRWERSGLELPDEIETAAEYLDALEAQR